MAAPPAPENADPPPGMGIPQDIFDDDADVDVNMDAHARAS
jgi:hypothetical protein